MAIGPSYNNAMYNQPGQVIGSTWATNTTTYPIWPPVASTPKSEYLPSTEEIDFFLPLLEKHCSNNDVKELLLILFDKLSQTPQEEVKISPEVVTALLTFCIEKYA